MSPPKTDDQVTFDSASSDPPSMYFRLPARPAGVHLRETRGGTRPGRVRVAQAGGGRRRVSYQEEPGPVFADGAVEGRWPGVTSHVGATGAMTLVWSRPTARRSSK